MTKKHSHRRPLARRSIRWLALGMIFAALVLWGAYARALAPGAPAPEISGGAWLNSRPLTINALKGRVVLIEFWTYG